MADNTSNTCSFDAGDLIYREGDLGREMYIIRSGQVQMLRPMGDGEVLLDTLGPNEFFGEMALFGSPRRTADVRAVTRTELLIINSRLLEAQFRNVPEWLVVMIKTIANRIQTTGRGVKVQFDVSFEFSALNIINLLIRDVGQQQDKGVTIPLDLARGEVVNILGIHEDLLDEWLKKLDFVNLIKIKGAQNQLLVPEEDRLDKYLKFLLARTKGGVMPEELDGNMLKAFERILKLLKHAGKGAA